MVNEFYEFYDPTWQNSEWISRCEPNENGYLLRVGMLIRPSFKKGWEIPEHPNGRIRGIREIGGWDHADVDWGTGVLMPVPLFALVHVPEML